MNNIVKNWKTSSLGAVAALPMIYEGIIMGDWLKVGSGLGLLLFALFAKDVGK